MKAKVDISLFVLAAVAIASLLISFCSHRRMFYRASGVEAVPPIVDLGRLPEGEIVSRTILLHNSTDKRVDVVQFLPSCGCTAADSPRAIQPHASVPLTIEFNSTEKLGEIKKSVTVMFARGVPAIVVQLTGHVYNEIERSASTIDFGTVPVGQSTVRNEDVRRNDRKSLRITKMTLSPGFGNYVSYTYEASDRVALKMTAGHLAGDFIGAINLSTDDSKMPSIRIPVRASVLGGYRRNVSDINMGMVSVGKKASRTIEVSGPSAARVLVQSLPLYVDAKVSVLSADRIRILVQFAPKGGTGTVINEKLVLGTGNRREPKIEIPLFATISL